MSKQNKIDVERAIEGLHDVELNKQICMWRGWKNTGIWQNFWISPNKSVHQEEYGFKLPDHINGDLAPKLIQEAEKRLGVVDKGRWDLIDAYMSTLFKIVQYPHICQTSHAWAYVTADSRQRAISILLVVRPKLFKNVPL